MTNQLIRTGFTGTGVPSTWPKFFLPDLTTGLLVKYKYYALGLADAATVSSVPAAEGSRTDMTLAASGAARPTFAITGMGGKPAIRFSGAQALITPVFTGDNIVAPATIVCVFQRSTATAPAAIEYLFSGDYSSSTVHMLAATISSAGVLGIGAGGSSGELTGASVLDTSLHICAFVFGTTTGTSKIYMDDLAPVVGTTGQATPAQAYLKKFTSGANPTGATSYLNGLKREEWIFNRAFNDSDFYALKSQIRAALAA